MRDDVLSIIYLLLILALILPGFIYANKNKKVLIKNLFNLGWNNRFDNNYIKNF